MKKFLSICLVLVFLLSVGSILFASGQTEDNEVKEFRLSWPPAYDESHGHTKAALAMNEVLDKETNGKVKFSFYAGGQLGTEKDVFEAIQMGTIDAAIMSGPIAAGFTDALIGFDLPYIFDNDLDFYYEVVTSDIAEELFEKLNKEAKVKGIAYLVQPGRDFYFSKPIRGIDDFDGVKLRSMQANIHVKTYEALGLSPTPLAYNEVYTAMQTGTVDGFEDVSVSVQANKTYETATHILISGHFNAAPIVIMSNKAWDSLTSSEKDAMMEAGRAAQLETLNHYKEQVPKTIEFMKKQGLEVNTIDMERAKKLVKPVLDSYAEEMPSVQKVIDKVNELKGK